MYAPHNTRLERTRRERASLLSNLGEPLKRSVRGSDVMTQRTSFRFWFCISLLAISAGSAFGSSGVLHAMRAFQYAEAMPKYQKGLDSQSAKSKWKSWRLSTLCIQTWMI
jgi:hypothetical protein